MIVRRSQLGDAVTHNQIAAGVSAGMSATAILYTTLAADPEPFSKAALAIAALCVSVFHGAFSGCGQTCVQATAVVNKLEPYLEQNRDQYLAQPVRTASMQRTALSLFDAVWQDVVSGCSDPNLGDAGKRCTGDRQRGGKWDWFALYRDPIANDRVQPDSVAQTVVSTFLPGVQLSPAAEQWLPLAFIAALVVLL